MNRNLVCFNANDPQLPQVDLFLRTLRDPDLGAFDGHICLLTTGVTPGVQGFLRKFDVEIIIGDLSGLFDWPSWRTVGAFEDQIISGRFWAEQPGLFYRLVRRILPPGVMESAELKRLQRRLRQLEQSSHKEPLIFDRLEQSFRTYRNKHFSKLLLRSFLRNSGQNYDRMILCDADMIFQTKIARVFDQLNDDRIWVGNEVNSIVPGTHIYGSNEQAKKFDIYERLSFGKDAHELNVGFVAGQVTAIATWMEDWQQLMFESGLEGLFTCHPEYYWHEQDFCRLLRDMDPGRFGVFGPELLVHVCNHGDRLLTETESRVFCLKETGEPPVVIHFCGGSWKAHEGLKREYERTREDVLNCG